MEHQERITGLPWYISALGKAAQPGDRGVGDTLARAFEWAKVDRAWLAFLKRAGYEDCGCKDRQEALNRQFPYQAAARPSWWPF